MFVVLVGLVGFGFNQTSAIGQGASPPYQLNPDLVDLPAGRWVKIHQQQFSDPVTFKRQRHGGSAFDSRRGRIVLFGSDTHENKTWLNSPLFFDLSKLQWRQLYPTDPLSSYQVNSEGLPVAGPNGDHPWAMHTFGAVTYDATADAIVVASYPEHMSPGRFTDLLKSLWPQVKRHPTWVLDLVSEQWAPIAGDAVQFFAHSTAFDPHRGAIIGYGSEGIHELSLADGQWRKVVGSGQLSWGNNAAYDSKNKALIVFGDNTRRDDVLIYLPDAGRHRLMPAPEPRPAGDVYVPMTFHPGLGQTVAIIDRPPEIGSGQSISNRADTWLYDYAKNEWSRVPRAELPFPVGMNFNLEFDPGHGLLLLVAEPPDHPLPAVWALRIGDEKQSPLSQQMDRSLHLGLTSSQTITETTPAIHVCPSGRQQTECAFFSVAAALAAAQDGDTIVIEAGDYKEAAIVRANRLTIKARPGAHLNGVAAEDKAALVVKGDDIVIEGLECSNIWVRHGNGACIRAEGSNLTLRRVYFHDSQEGILGGHGKVVIEDSVFERLGGDEKIELGQAHAIYILSTVDELILRGNRILSSKEEGHEVKSRAKRTVIENNVIASLEGRDSRLIDIPIGGETIIRNNILETGPNSSNPDIIAVGLERGRSPAKDHAVNSTLIEGNTIIIDRRQRTSLVNTRDVPPPIVVGNTIVGGLPYPNRENRWFKDRREANLPAYPALQRGTAPESSRAAANIRTARPEKNDETNPGRNFSRRPALTLHPRTGEAVWKGTPVRLTPQEFRLLALMHKNTNTILPTEVLYAAIGSGADDAEPGEETMRLILGLRRKFRAVDAGFASIVAHPSQGFGWNE